MTRLSHEDLKRRAHHSHTDTFRAMHDPDWPDHADTWTTASPGRRRRGLVAVAALGTTGLVLALALVLTQRPDDRVTTTSPTNAGALPITAEETTTSTTSPPSTTATTAAAIVPAVVPPSLTPSTSRPRPTTTRPNTTTTAIGPDQAAVTITNSYPAAVDVTINGRTYRVPSGGRVGPFGVTPAPDNDRISFARVDNPTCGAANADTYFRDLGDHTLRIEVGEATGCSKGEPSPRAWMEPGHRSV